MGCVGQEGQAVGKDAGDYLNRYIAENQREGNQQAALGPTIVVRMAVAAVIVPKVVVRCDSPPLGRSAGFWSLLIMPHRVTWLPSGLRDGFRYSQTLSALSVWWCGECRIPGRRFAAGDAEASQILPDNWGR